MRLDSETDKILTAAYNEAKFRNHEYFTPEHLLYSSLFFDEGKDIIENCSGDVESLKEDLIQYFKENLDTVENVDPEASLGVDNIVQSAAYHIASSGRDVIKIGDIMVAMFELKDSYAN
jgi:ATP-dependent Clp protease ATP-binding subunit ClpA